MEWKKDILRGIRVLPTRGVPGRIVVFGKNAKPIITGCSEEDVLVAAAEFGNGRIVAISHDAYSANFFENKQTHDAENDDDDALAKFHHNLKRWLTSGTFTKHSRIIDAKDDASKDQLASSKIVLYTGGQGNISSAVLTEFVRNGGALLHCLTPWGWQQLNSGKPLTDVPYMSLLSESGICYTEDYISVPESGFIVLENRVIDANLVNKKTEPMEWRKDILRGISVLPTRGVPGRVVVFGKNAEPIIIGCSEEDVLVAAAEFGNGRIVAISHDAYSANFFENKQTHDAENGDDDVLAKFHHNLNRWLTSGTFTKDSSIIYANDDTSKKQLASSKIVLYSGGQGNISSAVLAEFVRNGGALLHCLTPWGWQQLNSGKPLTDVPYMSLLVESGICYTGDYISVPDSGFIVLENRACDAHLLRVLKEAGTNFKKAAEKSKFLTRLKQLPKCVVDQLGSDLEMLWQNCRREIESSTIPSSHKPVTNKIDLGILELWLLCFDVLQLSNIKAPGISSFPGDFSAEPPLVCHTLEFHSDREDYHSTGCYLPAGQTLKVEVISGNEGHDWMLMIGCHTDELQNNELRRWPTVSKRTTLVNKSLELSTPFGGLIYFISPDRPNLSLSVKLENVADSPRFTLLEGEKGKETWKHSRQSPGLWADIVGELITITMPSSSVRELEFDALTSVMKIWDSVVRSYHDLRGTDVTKHRRMWIVTDEQPSAGYMHSGYPIVTHLDVADPKNCDFLLNGAALERDGNWGAFHEIGHNMQRGEWTFDGTGEVTVNIFTLCAMDEVCHQKPWIHKWLQGQLPGAENFLKDGADFRNWKSTPGIALFVYAQLVHEFGWESYRKVFRRYEAMTESEKPTDDQQKRDKWFSTFSEVVGFNLAPLASFWGIPVSVDTVDRLHTAFPVGFLPDDEVTRFAPDRVDSVLRKFPGTIRKICSLAQLQISV